ncbi:MAG: phospholipase D family protein [Brachymonas denitrificans]
MPDAGCRMLGDDAWCLGYTGKQASATQDAAGTLSKLDLACCGNACPKKHHTRANIRHRLIVSAMPPAAPVLTATRPLPLWRVLLWVWVLLAALVLAGCGTLPPPGPRTESQALPAGTVTPLSKLAGALRKQSRSRHDTGFLLLDSADSAFSSRLALTRQATRTLDLQYYAIHNDPGTGVLLAAIREAAARGVRVRILLDDLHTKGEDAEVLQLAFVPNVEMRLFNPLPAGRSMGKLRALSALQDFSRLQHRMHNKLFLADNVAGIVGGRNLGDAYFGQADDSNYIDLDVLAIGALVPAMSRSFDRYWNHPLAYPVEQLMSRRDLKAMVAMRRSNPSARAGGGDEAEGESVAASAPADLPGAMALEEVAWTWAPSALLADAPAKLSSEERDVDGGDQVVSGLLGLMRLSRRSVLIVTPYFVPGAQMMQVFAGLRRRGIAVVVLTNSLASSDAPLAHIGYERYRRELLKLGVEVHEMRALQPQSVRSALGSSGKARHASLHAKLVLMDDTWLGIGSMNLDLRSQLQNSEVAVLIRSRLLGRLIRERVTPIVREGAWRLELAPDGRLQWHAPAGVEPAVQHGEPDASATLQFLLKLAAPFTPDEML